jgi:hypothetical protein
MITETKLHYNESKLRNKRSLNFIRLVPTDNQELEVNSVEIDYAKIPLLRQGYVQEPACY